MASEDERTPLELRSDTRVSPREVELTKFRENRTMLTVTLVTGQTLEGAIRWFDPQAVRLVQPDRSELTVYLHAIAYYRTKV